MSHTPSLRHLLTMYEKLLASEEDIDRRDLASRRSSTERLRSLDHCACRALLRSANSLSSTQRARPIGTSTQTLSEKEVEALLATPAASAPIGADGTSRRVREPKVAQMQKASRVARPRPRGIPKNPQ